MRISINDELKTIMVWLESGENFDSKTLDDEIAPNLKQFIKNKYRLVMFHSGTEDYVKNTELLLKNNMSKNKF